MSEFDIVPIEPSDHDLVQSWLVIGEAVERHDWLAIMGWQPTLRMMGLLQRRADTDFERWAAVKDGEAVGWIGLELPVRDNTHLAKFNLEVHPDHRRRGVGSALLEHMERRAAALGRTTVSTWALAPIDGGPAMGTAAKGFSAAAGYRNTLDTVVRVCDLDAVADAELERLWTEAWARAAGFEVVEFEGTPPEDVIDGMAYLHARMYTDMPLGEWDLQEADFDAARVADEERQRRERGELSLQVAVRHKDSGEIVGFTQIIVEGGREHHCYQGDTIVDPRFRGHRLGTILKIANQRRIREWRPKMRYVWTGNAATNEHMIAINEAIGYRKICMEHVWQKKLP
ncbi:GNAT family N-acetyltransferase [Glycomyces sp. L485]|uniref:GNAT family N-acetyltransferase n=1 Tax=Glycomyces sp. L485 TaxID=2909235 RepID=UPI001F4AD2EF|nr:GNAT family N-acetyltransferase [Glycomyces sp. L485]MCH7232772.1 GNAT family N-acetyltransferase [Glycomyces sp. L485]